MITVKEIQELKKDFELLNIENITVKFGGLKAVDSFSLELKHREIVGLIGPNGAGKTTVFNTITGVYKPERGRIYFEGRPINHLSLTQMNNIGIARTFQNIRLFSSLTVFDNIRIALNNKVNYSLFQVFINSNDFKTQEEKINDKTREFLEIFELYDYKDRIASSLPYGKQRRLEIARALATEPKLLLLDEPAAGMNEKETGELMELIKWLMVNFDISIILIEHDIKFVMNLCPRIIVLDYGRIIAEGKPEEIRNNKKVIEAYLGE